VSIIHKKKINIEKIKWILICSIRSTGIQYEHNRKYNEHLKTEMKTI